MSSYDPEEYWRIDDTVINEFYEPMPSYTIGEKTSLEFGFKPFEGETDEEHAERVKQVMKYSRHAGAYVYHELLNGGAVYTEQHRNDTLLVAVKSPSTQPIDYSAWTLIDGIDRIGSERESHDAFRLTVDYLADLDDYPDKQSVKNDLVSSGFR